MGGRDRGEMDETFEFHTAQAASFKSNLRGHENFRIKFRPVLRHAMQHSTEVREQRRKFRAPGVPQFKYIYTYIYIYIYFFFSFSPNFFPLSTPVLRFSSVPPSVYTSCAAVHRILSSWKVYYVYPGEIHAARRRNLACQGTVNFRPVHGGGNGVGEGGTAA